MKDVAAATEAKRELFRLTFARWDIKLAKTLCSWLLSREHPTGSDIYTALWTSLAVCYARPFSKNNIGVLASRWGRFDDDQMRSTHDALIAARNRDFAHTDRSPARSVSVFPPGAWTDKGDATVAVIPWSREVVEDAARLCDVQIERLGERIRELVAELYGGEEWPEGALIQLDYPEECSFCGRVLERPWQERAGRNRAYICHACIAEAALHLPDEAWPEWFRPSAAVRDDGPPEADAPGLEGPGGEPNA